MEKKERILVIDDEESMRDSCCQALRKEGYILETADNGNAGLKKIKDLKPDLVLVDLKMPGISGMEIAPFPPLTDESSPRQSLPE